jgi:hypothetical protein
MKSLNGSTIEDEGKLGHGFTSADELEKIDLGDGSKPRPTYFSAKLDIEYKIKLITLLKEFKMVKFEYIPKCHNSGVNRLVQKTSNYQLIPVLVLPNEN